MCGNFGLLLLQPHTNEANGKRTADADSKDLDGQAIGNRWTLVSFPSRMSNKVAHQDELDNSYHEVFKLDGVRRIEKVTSTDVLKNPLKILEAQTACTEIRGGQAGGYSSIEYNYKANKNYQENEAAYRCSELQAEFIDVPYCLRVRKVARKRHPLAADLAKKYDNHRHMNPLSKRGPLSVICHTRFATSSDNEEKELHPHEWVPFHMESVWMFDSHLGRFYQTTRTVGVHITHNGDFDAIDAYSHVMVNEELGQWLERVLYASSTARLGDSPKIAGMMDLLRVQGRWGAAARLAWVRCICKSSRDVAGGDQLNKDAPNSFPPPCFWDKWHAFLNNVWKQHVNNVIIVNRPSVFDLNGVCQYSVDLDGFSQLTTSIFNQLEDGGFIPMRGRDGSNAVTSATKENDELGVFHIDRSSLRGFIHHCVRGFLYNDLYHSLTEFMSRAHGSFGIQVHSTMEPGVVVIASKGQPMGISYDNNHPIVLFGSEAEALAVPVFESEKWLEHRLDLDSKGEVLRCGLPRSLQDGTYAPSSAPKSLSKKYSASVSDRKLSDPSPQLLKKLDAASGKWKNANDAGLPGALFLRCGIELRSYSLLSNSESSPIKLLRRTVQISVAAPQYDPRVDLVLKDLSVTPAVLTAIDRAWQNPQSVEGVAGRSLAKHLMHCMKTRLLYNHDTIDLLVSGVEASLWLAEQFAADLRRIFPHLNVTVTSANKLLGFGSYNTDQVFSPVAEEVLPRRITKSTCILMISQSGQTFPTLHATRLLARIYPEKLWLLTGCFNSKMEQVLQQAYADLGKPWGISRVMNNYSGHRPAEPSSVAVAATWHTLTRLILRIAKTCRREMPGGRLLHPWEYDQAALIIQAVVRGFTERNRLRHLENEKLQSSRVVHNRSVRISEAAEHSDADDSGIDDVLEEMERTFEPRAVASLNSIEVDSSFGNDDDSTFASSLERVPSCDSLSISSSIGQIKPRRLTRLSSTRKYLMKGLTHTKIDQVMNLSDGCISDINHLLSESFVPMIEEIVGYNSNGIQLDKNNDDDSDNCFGCLTWFDILRKKWNSNNIGKLPWTRPKRKPMHHNSDEKQTLHEALVAQGQAWADHISEPWDVLVLAGCYVLLSVGLGLPLFVSLGNALLAILIAAGLVRPSEGRLSFSLLSPGTIVEQPYVYTVVGFVLQVADALFFIYLAKHITRSLRVISGRPLAARHGKRTIVIVDNPTVHQLLENFVSKLYSQSYGVVSVDVHGASGLDHFVHRFTHRVVRGVLLAIGRPDGRVGSLAKSEAAVLLAAKQAAFIKNPEYAAEGAGPEIVTIGHNPFEPNLGLSHHIVLNPGLVSRPECSRSLTRSMSISSVQGFKSDEIATATKVKIIHKMKRATRRKFVEEYLYDRLFLAQRPFTTSILRTLRSAHQQDSNYITGMQHPTGGGNGKDHDPLADRLMPFGVHHIDPNILEQSEQIESSVLADFFTANRDMLTKKILEKGIVKENWKSYDPAVRSAFYSKLDQQTKQIQNLQVSVQQFYECRIASLERYMAFCVMFHAMATKTSHPWLSAPWDIARSQSNLRVATTASPISAGGGEAAAGGGGGEESNANAVDTFRYARKVAMSLRGFTPHF